MITIENTSMFFFFDVRGFEIILFLRCLWAWIFLSFLNDFWALVGSRFEKGFDLGSEKMDLSGFMMTQDAF